MCFGKIYVAIFLQMAIPWAKQAVSKKFSLINILTWHSHTTSSD